MSRLIISSSYKKLVSEIVRFYDTARKSQAEFYWNAGRKIVEVEQDGAPRAHRHAGLLQKLSNDLTQKCGPGFSVTNLERMRIFYLRNPKSSPAKIISWSHQVELMPIESDARRLHLERKVIEKGLTRDELRKMVQWEVRRNRVDRNGKPPELLKPVQGSLYTYRILDSSSIQGSEPNLLLIDLGFSSFRDLDAVTSKHFKPGDIVESRKFKDDQYQVQKIDKTKDALYTYEATVEKVVDADTLHVVVDLGFNTRTRQYLRLRGINAPERDTPEGKRASEFVKDRIKAASKIILTSSRSDKYDRYLADIFFTNSKGKEVYSDGEVVNKPRGTVPEPSKFRYLNNLLLETKHAVRMGT